MTSGALDTLYLARSKTFLHDSPALKRETSCSCSGQSAMLLANLGHGCCLGSPKTWVTTTGTLVGMRGKTSKDWTSTAALNAGPQKQGGAQLAHSNGGLGPRITCTHPLGTSICCHPRVATLRARSTQANFNLGHRLFLLRPVLLGPGATWANFCLPL